MKETYKVLVTYGYLDDKTGISHIVHVSEPDASVDSTAVVASLAQQLDTYPDNKDFSWDAMPPSPTATMAASTSLASQIAVSESS